MGLFFLLFVIALFMSCFSCCCYCSSSCSFYSSNTLPGLMMQPPCSCFWAGAPFKWPVVVFVGGPFLHCALMIADRVPVLKNLLKTISYDGAVNL